MLSISARIVGGSGFEPLCHLNDPLALVNFNPLRGSLQPPIAHITSLSMNSLLLIIHRQPPCIASYMYGHSCYISSEYGLYLRSRNLQNPCVNIVSIAGNVLQCGASNAGLITTNQYPEQIRLNYHGRSHRVQILK